MLLRKKKNCPDANRYIFIGEKMILIDLIRIDYRINLARKELLENIKSIRVR